ncbi:uncharacterized protein LOC123905427 [Trifolium pratense]|uniref:uncharacterized protein LOC123905427 n=1 Tax=Trifolium pratense TaxID=57577 RepID=UPI001E696B55|nr:uncharacterized protein LOC123905427 [Trifolium pratense]
MTANNADMKVADLIDNVTGSWNNDLIQQIFCPRDVLEITKIPLKLMQNDDVPIWKCCHNGNYSVRSAYYHLVEVVIDNNHLKVEGNWNKLWKLMVPNKVKIFLWRVLRGCMASQEVWQETDCWQAMTKHNTHAISFVSMMFNMIDELDNNSMSTVAMVLWSLWWRRNQKCWNEFAGLEASTVPCYARTRTETTPDLLSWSKPPRGSLKCNIDAACYTKRNIYCVGACIRDENGRFVKAFAKCFEGKPEIYEAEAKAIGLLECLTWLNSM